MLAGEKADRKRAVNLPELSRFEDPAVEAPDALDHLFGSQRRLAVALWSMRNEVLSRAPCRFAVTFYAQCGICGNFGLATNRRGARPGNDCDVGASAAGSCVAMRTVPT